MKRSTLSAALISAVVTAVLVGGGVAIASSDDPEVLHACARNKSGQLRLVESPDDCKRKETGVSWGTTGPQGLPGSPGADGPPGTPGVDLSGGLFDFYSAVVFNPTNNGCPNGQYRWVVGQQWGTTLPWQPGPCTDPLGSTVHERILSVDLYADVSGIASFDQISTLSETAVGPVGAGIISCGGPWFGLDGTAERGIPGLGKYTSVNCALRDQPSPNESASPAYLDTEPQSFPLVFYKRSS